MRVNYRIISLLTLYILTGLLALFIVSLAFFSFAEFFYLYIIAVVGVVLCRVYSKITDHKGVYALGLVIAMVGYCYLSQDVAMVKMVRQQQLEQIKSLVESKAYYHREPTKRANVLPFNALVDIINQHTNTSVGWSLMSDKDAVYVGESLYYLHGGERTLFLLEMADRKLLNTAQYDCLMDSLDSLRVDMLLDNSSIDFDKYLRSESCQYGNLIENVNPFTDEYVN